MTDITDHITLASSLAALLTAVASLLTLREMKKQRDAIYQPGFAVSNGGFYAYYTPQNVCTVACADDALPSAEIVKNEVALLHLDIFNIGLGVAKDVHVQWEYSLEAFRGLMQQQDIAHRFDIQFVENSLEVVHREERVRVSFMLPAGAVTTIPFVLPTNVQQDPTSLVIPYSYYYAFLCTLFAIIIEQNQEPMSNWPQLPPLTLLLRYDDIGANRHRMSVRLKPRLLAWTSAKAIEGCAHFALGPIEVMR